VPDLKFSRTIRSEYLTRIEASIFQGVAKLPPGSMLTLSVADVQAGVLPTPQRWWSAEAAARAAMADEPLSDPQAAVSEVERALSHSVKEQMLADVPLGAFLSGGIDSSLIVALMQQQAERPVRTFSVGFDDARYDESQHAAARWPLGARQVRLQADPVHGRRQAGGGLLGGGEYRDRRGLALRKARGWPGAMASGAKRAADRSG